MENITGRKVIFLLLNVLLIAGAIFAVMTIDGGKWLISNPAFYQPPEEAQQQNVVVPVTGSGFDVKTQDELSAPSGYGCQHETGMNPADW